jgi:integrase/recombinase XerD
MSTTALREKFIQQMELKGYSKNTIQVYLDCLIQLSKFYKTSPDKLSLVEIRDYLQHCVTTKKLSQSYLNQMVSALKILFVQVLKREWDPIAIPRMRREKKLPVVLSKEEVQQLFSVIRNDKHLAIMTLIYSAGLRMGEARTLKIEDIDSKRMQIRIKQAKGNKDRYAILSPVALEVLRRYYKKYKPCEWLFETKKSICISEKTIQVVFKNSIKKAGIQKKVSVHVLRHSFATHMMEQGVSLPLIQQLLGHSALRTTSVYLHVQQYAIDKVKSPLDFLSI